MHSKIRPLKRFGQNYLVDKNIINKIVDTFNPSKDETIIEIGPGTGALTRAIFERIGPYTVVEIDKRVIEDLKRELPGINVIHKDFIEINLEELTSRNKKLRVVGNIPYNITSSILFKLFSERKIMNDALLMVQYEVAKRMLADRGTKDYGILSVLINYFTDSKLCFKISPNVFYPKPKVWSAIVHLKFNNKVISSVSDVDFIKVVKASFGNRRKILKNSLSNSIFRKSIADLRSFSLNRRAEELSTGDFIELTKLLKENPDG
ncbi:MAG: 16S rRNA (adenine(1518)-N(6)/adenine(1519)-N(6))-dimethyltransferase RsmA [Bacteroidota bacterium]